MVTTPYTSSYDDRLDFPRDSYDWSPATTNYCYVHCHKSPSDIISTLVNLSLQQLRELHNKVSVCIIFACQAQSYRGGDKKLTPAEVEKLLNERRYLLADDKFLLELIDEQAKLRLRKMQKHHNPV